MWILFHVPRPTPDGRTARDLFEKRVKWIGADMQESAVRHGCRFHRAWYASDRSAFWALANWESRESANAFFTERNIEGEPCETATGLEGHVGLVPLP